MLSLQLHFNDILVTSRTFRRYSFLKASDLGKLQHPLGNVSLLVKDGVGPELDLLQGHPAVDLGKVVDAV